MSEIKAIDELREFVDDQFVISGQAYLQGMAIANSIEAEIAEKYMELPCDCDGVPIQMWDRVKAEGYEDGKVASIEVRGNGTDWIGVLPDGWDTPTVYRSDCLRHYKPRTVEDVLMDVMSDFADADFNDETLETITARYADEIRELLGSDARWASESAMFAKSPTARSAHMRKGGANDRQPNDRAAAPIA